LAKETVETNIQPAKAIPVSKAELERIQSEFRFFSPVQKACKSSPPSREGEQWKLERTLPSALFLGVERKWWEELLDKYPKGSDDFRPFQYDVERHQRETPWLYADKTRATHSVSWHPAKMLLVTAGEGGVTKLWDVETGDLITRRPYWSSYSSGDAISWSYDGEVFADEKYIFDGRTGEKLSSSHNNLQGHRIPVPGLDDLRYSTSGYHQRRGGNDDLRRGTSHLSSSNNFGPWRPSSNQYLLNSLNKNMDLNPWKLSSDQYVTGLVFRNRRTGEVEKVIDCNVPSAIEDFAWHPSGQFIAASFREHNIRIIDIDEARTVDSLSVQHLVGWDPDGKVLVLRKEKGKDDFLIWDALETKEKPLPEEMKQQLWFKRFFANISADGLRYIKGANIYSVESDRLLATLPTSVTCAAWSPIDGGLLATCRGTETKIWRLKA